MNLILHTKFYLNGRELKCYPRRFTISNRFQVWMHEC